VSDAIAIFKLNAETFPLSANTWDSLAEAQLAHGDRDDAIANYKKSLALNPRNKNAEEHLKQLETPAPKP
jgi:predicted Zn-dependent protease